MSDPGKLSINDAIHFALLSQAAYGKIIVPVRDPASKFFMVDMTPAADCQCLIVLDSDRITFAFRGTDDFRKMLADANVMFHDLGNGLKVHAGAWKLLDALWPRLSIEADTHLPIYTTGHSLGGMLARLFTLRLAREKNIKVSESMTFGEARTLNKGAADFYNRLNIPTYRLVDAADIVTRVPWRLGLYKHVGRSCFIDQTGQITFDEPWYAHILTDAVEVVQEAFRRENAPIYDHGIVRYINALTTYRLQIGV